MSCGCTDPAAGGEGGCCSLSDTLAVGNNATGFEIAGLGAPGAPDSAARLIDIGGAFGHGGQAGIDGLVYNPGDYLTLLDNGALNGLSIAAHPSGGSILLPPDLVSSGVGMGLWYFGAIVPFTTPAGVTIVQSLNMYWVKADGTFVSIVDVANQTFTARPLDNSDNAIRLGNFVNWRAAPYADCGIALQLQTNPLEVNGNRWVYGFRVGG